MSNYFSILKLIHRVFSKILSLDIIWISWVFINKKFNFRFRYYKQNPYEIPIVINNFNKLYTLKGIVDKLIELGYKNIFVIDNNSSYPPLLEYYLNSKEQKKFELILSENLGHRNLFLSKDKRLKKIRKSCFIYSDSDLLLNENLPKNFVELMFDTLLKYDNVLKVGFAIRIDDINPENIFFQEISKWEQGRWKKQIDNNVYLASIDTTFALYRPILYKKTNSIVRFYKGIRLAGDFTCQHEPWYWDFKNLDDEQRFYINNANSSSSYVNFIKGKVLNI